MAISQGVHASCNSLVGAIGSAPAVPLPVAQAVDAALERLRNICTEVDRASSLERILGMTGHYQADVYRNRTKDMEQARNTLAQFRQVIAPYHGIDAEQYIADLGGEPELRPCRHTQAWLDSSCRLGPSVSVVKIVYAVGYPGADAVEHSDPAAAAKAFHEMAAKKRPYVVRTLTCGDGSESTSVIANTVIAAGQGRQTFGKWASESDPAFLSEYRHLTSAPVKLKRAYSGMTM